MDRKSEGSAGDVDAVDRAVIEVPGESGLALAAIGVVAVAALLPRLRRTS